MIREIWLNKKELDVYAEMPLELGTFMRQTAYSHGLLGLLDYEDDQKIYDVLIEQNIDFEMTDIVKEYFKILKDESGHYIKDNIIRYIKDGYVKIRKVDKLERKYNDELIESEIKNSFSKNEKAVLYKEKGD